MNEGFVETPLTGLVGLPGGRVDLDYTAKGIGQDAAARGEAIRLRLQPDLFVPGSGGKYMAYSGVHWRMQFATTEELIQFRGDLGAFIEGWFRERAQAAAGATGAEE